MGIGRNKKDLEQKPNDNPYDPTSSCNLEW